MSFDCRRGGRLSGNFWIMVAGADSEQELRKGNISISGIYFETDRGYGPPGTIRRVSIGLDEEQLLQGRALELLGRVVREVGYDDLNRGRVVAGVAFEYLVEQQNQRVAIEKFLRELASRQLERADHLHLACHLTAEVSQSDESLGSATVKNLSVEGMVLRADGPMSVGQPISVQVRAPSSSRVYRFEGIAVSCDADGFGGTENGDYTIEVKFSEANEEGQLSGGIQREVAFEVESSLSGSSSIRGAVEALLEESVVPSAGVEPSPLAHLKGTLAQISLWSLLGFLETERRTGVLWLRWGANRGEIYLHDGQVVDVSSSYREALPRDQVAHLLDWLDGEFKMQFVDVDREDRLGVSTTALLMDLAKEKDEVTPVGELDLDRVIFDDFDPE